MKAGLYLPSDEFSDPSVADWDRAADYLELSALFAEDGQSYSEYIVDALEMSADEVFVDVDDEIKKREEVAAGAVARMSSRSRILGASYPFEIDDDGYVISFVEKYGDFGHIAYIVSLILSNLKAVSPMLVGSEVYPSQSEIRSLRCYFQYLATAAIAAEVGGPAWSFGFPRPDGSGFLKKLSEIWGSLRDGNVGADPSASPDPKDDQIDIFAWREQKDGLPGFLLVAAQVATGKNWKAKPIRDHVANVFYPRWFNRSPATQMVAYHIIPFARADEEFRDDVLVLGNVMHRLRVPFRVREAIDLVERGTKVEAFDLLCDVSDWVQCYVTDARKS